jgi:4-amino-4-deoxy-L-arabinose transferase-like glycosyltransferase
MLTSGDWVVPRFLDKVRTAKPPFTAWCQASAMAVLGQNAFAARLPSAVAMVLTLGVLAVVLGRFADRQRAFWTVLILVSSAIVIAWSARTSLTDSVLLLWITIAQICLYAMYRGNRSWPVVIIWAGAFGLAGLTKGPVVLGMQAMTLLALAAMNWKRLIHRNEPRGFEEIVSTDRGTGASPVPCSRIDQLHGRGARATMKVVAALVIVAALNSWWYLVEKRAPGFVGTAASRDVVQRVFEPLEQHKGPPGYYAIIVWGIYFPWSVLLPLTIVVALRHFREDESVRFALAAVIGPWLMLECVQTKLPHYLLPVFPPLAYLTADAIVRCLRGEHDDLTSRGTRAAVIAWSFIVVALGFVPLSVDLESAHAAAIACAASGLVYGGAVALLFRGRRPAAGLIAMGTGDDAGDVRRPSRGTSRRRRTSGSRSTSPRSSRAPAGPRATPGRARCR